MGAEIRLQGNVGASAEVIHREDTFDVELHQLLDQALIWIDAVKGPAIRLVEEAETIARDGDVQAIILAQKRVNEALQRLIKAAYEREIR
jgi:hypothetical protein